MFSGGLSFSSGVDFNYNTSGNPGIFLTGFYKVNNRFQLGPSLTLYNRTVKGDAYYKLTNYMFHFDIDGRYGIIKEEQIVLFALAGLNAQLLFPGIKCWKTLALSQLIMQQALNPGLTWVEELKCILINLLTPYYQQNIHQENSVSS